MARALWRGAISFGLVYLPIEVHTASRENPLPLHLLDRRDFAPVGYQHINKRTGEQVDWKDIVKGYEYKKGDYVVLTDADFQHANVKASETIEIERFCDAADIAPIYFEKPYYLAPGKGGGKVYALFRQALSATAKVAIGSFVMHQRQHMCAIAPSGSALTLLTLRFEDEIVPLSSSDSASAKVTPAELTMAKQLVNQMTGKFEPSHFKDTYRDDLKHRVQEKIRHKETHALDVAPPPQSERPKAQVIDLMEALRASLANKKTASPAKKRSSRRKRA